MKSLLSLTNVVKQYQIATTTHRALQDISLTINTGDMLAIIGASGSGKSTLMNILGLLDRASEGVYRFQGQDVTELTDDQLADLRNRCFGFVFQQFHLLPRFTALQNVALPLTYRNVSSQWAKRQALDALNRVAMADFSQHRPSQLSGGQQQRVAIARALVGEPSIILADEPTGALDAKTAQDIMTLFLSLHAEGRTLILVTHDKTVAQACCKQLTLDQGRMLTDPSTAFDYQETYA